METGDFNLILSFAISVFLNLSVILTLVVFTEKDASYSSKVDKNNKKVDEKTSTHPSKFVENDSEVDKNDRKGSSNSPKVDGFEEIRSLTLKNVEKDESHPLIDDEINEKESINASKVDKIDENDSLNDGIDENDSLNDGIDENDSLNDEIRSSTQKNVEKDEKFDSNVDRKDDSHSSNIDKKNN